MKILSRIAANVELQLEYHTEYQEDKPQYAFLYVSLYQFKDDMHKSANFQYWKLSNNLKSEPCEYVSVSSLPYLGETRHISKI